MKKTVLITGVAGLLGSRLADWIIENKPEYEVVGVDDLSGGYEENIHKDVKFWQMDLTEHPIENIFTTHKIDYVFHFAAYAAEGLSPFIRCYNYDNNLKSTAKIINECIKHDVKRLVFTSTLAVYGHGNGGIFDESQQQAPIDPYGVAKYGCEMDIQIAGEQHGLDWCIIRPHNVYGVKQNIWDKYRNVLGIWMYQIINGMQPTIFGDGEQKRAFSYVDDSLVPFWNASQNDDCIGEIINLGGIKEYTINEACQTLLKVTGTDLKPKYLEERHEAKYAWSTWEKSVDLLGFEHRIDLEEGLTKMWEWAQAQPNRKRFVWSNYELDKGIYEFWK